MKGERNGCWHVASGSNQSGHPMRRRVGCFQFIATLRVYFHTEIVHLNSAIPAVSSAMNYIILNFNNFYTGLLNIY